MRRSKVQGHECLSNLQHKDNDNNLVKDNSWKETAGELNAQLRNFHEGHSTVREWQGNGMVSVNRPKGKQMLEQHMTKGHNLSHFASTAQDKLQLKDGYVTDGRR
jgi:hypothetical protein